MPTIASAASANLAKRALGELIERTPYSVKAVQTDGASELMADFEEACQEKGIRLFVLPPQGLGYRTPAQSLQDWATKKQNEVSRTC